MAWLDPSGPDGRVRLAQVMAVFVSTMIFGVWGIAGGLLLAGSIELWHRSQQKDSPSTPSRRQYLARTLRQQVQSLAAMTFVDVAKGVIFENSPHRTFLHERVNDVNRALLQLNLREGQVNGLREELTRTNQRLGRPPEDEEVLALGRELARLGEQRVKLTELERHLDEQLARFDAALEQLRLLATRRALSDHVGRVLEGTESETVRRAAAAIEVDILELEGRFRDLSVELSDADAELRAVLEVQGELMRR